MNFSTPIALLGVAALLVVGGLAVRGCTGDGQRKAEAGQALAQDDLAGRTLEVKGNAQVADEAATLGAQIATTRKAADALDEEARADPAGRAPLAPSSLARLRAGDRELCASGRGACH